MLCWSLQRSCTTEPVTAALGTSQDGVCGGTRGHHKSRVKAEERREERLPFTFGCFVFLSEWCCSGTQDFEGNVGLSQGDGVQRRADLTAILPGIFLGHPLQGHRGPFDARPPLKGT